MTTIMIPTDTNFSIKQGKNQMLTLDDMANFTWTFGMHFFLEVGEKGNFVWSCPSYGGNNTITPYAGSWNDFRKEYGLEVGRDKGFHIISVYCGENVKILNS